jgi:hypothetical protein
MFHRSLRFADFVREEKSSLIPREQAAYKTLDLSGIWTRLAGCFGTEDFLTRILNLDREPMNCA